MTYFLSNGKQKAVFTGDNNNNNNSLFILGGKVQLKLTQNNKNKTFTHK